MHATPDNEQDTCLVGLYPGTRFGRYSALTSSVPSPVSLRPRIRVRRISFSLSYAA